MPEYISCSDDAGTVSISEEVIISLITNSLADVDGFGGFANLAAPERLGFKNAPRGIRLSQSESGLTADIYMLVRYGYGISEVAERVQETAGSAVESMTGFTSVINVHVTGISFERAEIK